MKVLSILNQCLDAHKLEIMKVYQRSLLAVLALIITLNPYLANDIAKALPIPSIIYM